MSDDEDDYLSDKFLLLGDKTTSSSKPSSSTSRPKTYSELRKEALRASEAKQAAGRKKSKREIVEQGLNTSLFDKAKEEEEAGLGKNRALGMMLKMGFKPGQSLGRTTNPGGAPVSDKGAPPVLRGDTVVDATAAIWSSHRDGQRIEPVAINLWEGRSGIGQKRSHSSKANPYAPAKKARTLESEAKENESAEAFRERTRQEYEEKRTEARLVAATRTCLSLDQESRGLEFNILWLNPKNPNTCPQELLDAFARDAAVETFDDDPMTDPEPLDDDDEPTPRQVNDRLGLGDTSRAARLKEQMRRDNLQPAATDFDDFGQDLESYAFGLRGLQDGGVENETDTLEFSVEQVTEAREFLGLPVKDRLDRVLSYMRKEYTYCFWCGTRYRDKEDLDVSCPGEDEEAHD